MHEAKDYPEQYLQMVTKPYVATELLDGVTRIREIESATVYSVLHNGELYAFDIYDYGWMQFAELHKYLRANGIPAVPILDISTDPSGESVFGGERKGIVIRPAIYEGEPRLLKILNPLWSK